MTAQGQPRVGLCGAAVMRRRGKAGMGSLVVLHLARSLTEKKDIYQAILTMSHNKTVGYPSRQFQLAM